MNLEEWDVLLKPSLPRAAHRHEILFCSDHAAFLDGLTHFILAALSAGSVIVVAVSETNGERLVERLRQLGLDIDAAIEQGKYVPVSAHDLLSMFMVDGWPDADRFSSAVSYLIERAASGTRGERPRVVACGECAPALWVQGSVEAAIRLEHLLNEVSRNHQLDILCVYPSIASQKDDQSVEDLCAAHTAVNFK
jgi:MEDS: MEthanogen/methylotroph, DcmR Sensory domain